MSTRTLSQFRAERQLWRKDVAQTLGISEEALEALERSSEVPPEIAQTVTVTGREAALIGRSEPECYDRVLADVPCSAEAHLLRRPQELERWSPARVKSLALRQFAILVSGLDALKIGGELLYSTCSIAPEENDGVIAKLLKKRPHAVVLIPFASPGEATEFGRIVLPDTERGRGPLYLCKLRKTASSQKPRQ